MLGAPSNARAKPAPLRAINPGGMGLVQDQHGVMARRQRRQIGQRGAVAIHAVKRFHRDPDLAAPAFARANAVIASSIALTSLCGVSTAAMRAGSSPSRKLAWISAS